jgi:hypothetical protein
VREGGREGGKRTMHVTNLRSHEAMKAMIKYWYIEETCKRVCDDRALVIMLLISYANLDIDADTLYCHGLEKSQSAFCPEAHVLKPAMYHDLVWTYTLCTCSPRTQGLFLYI